jgi:Uma2 family endonuclease
MKLSVAHSIAEQLPESNEILSPDQSQTKVMKNILHCLAHGSQMGWLIDPTTRSVIVYSRGQLPVVST